MSVSIASSAILVDLNIRMWSARKLDKAVTEEVNSAKRASSSASRVNKNLLPDVAQIENIIKHGAAARNWVMANSMPWADRGTRLVPTASFFEFKQKIDEFEREFWQLVDDFVLRYPFLINAQAFKLGDMFNRDEYPDADEIKYKYDFRVSYIPVPEAGDFRLDIHTEALEQLQSQYEQEYARRLDEAMNDVRDRLLTSIEHIVDRLEPVEEGKTKKFHSTMLDNFAELVSRVRAFNLTKDQALDRLCVTAEKAIEGVDVEDLRKNDDVRKDVQTRMKEIVDAFSF